MVPMYGCARRTATRLRPSGDCGVRTGNRTDRWSEIALFATNRRVRRKQGGLQGQDRGVPCLGGSAGGGASPSMVTGLHERLAALWIGGRAGGTGIWCIAFREHRRGLTDESVSAPA